MRMTRAALRAQASHESLAIHEDADATEETRNSPYDVSRPVLKDITEENTTISETVPEKDGFVKETQASKSSTTEAQNGGYEEVAAEAKSPILEPLDSITVTSSPTVPEITSANIAGMSAVEARLDVAPETSSPLTPTGSRTTPNTVQEDLQTPEIITQTSKEQSETSKTPKFIPEVYEPVATAMGQSEDSFIDAIKSRSPGKLGTEASEHGDDSFVDKIISRTPRPASRIEDSVEAMDRLEDALEEFSGEMPVISDLRIDSPMKEKPARSPLSTHKATATPLGLKKATSPARRSPSRDATKTTAVSQPKPNIAASTSQSAVSKPRARPSTVKPPAKLPAAKPTSSRPFASVSRPATKATQPSRTSNNSTSTVQVDANKKRAVSDSLSTSRPGFVPTKSSKPVTKPTFSLPGDAYAAKMKAQREEKLRKEEEDAATRRQFKARPAPTASGRPSVLPRENKASQARLSRVFSGPDKENVAPKPTASKRPTSMLLDVRKVRTDATSSIRRATSVTSKSSSGASREPKFAANVPRVASLTSKPVVPKEEIVAPNTHKKVTGKEVFGRSKLELKKQEEEKREKEEAARKARAEAAERGRQASREWAEKQKARLAAQKAAKITTQEAAAAV
jgi:hypothetical protein